MITRSYTNFGVRKELLAWKSGLPSPVQGLSPNSTALTLLDGFAKGNIQMQGEAVKHLQEENLAKLRNVTIELMEPDGKVLGTIKNVNFLEESVEKVEEPTTGELLGELELGQDVIIENVADVCSMGKQKKGRMNPTKPSPASKVKAKKQEEKAKASTKVWAGTSWRNNYSGQRKTEDHNT